MAKTTINVKYADGTAIDLTKRVIAKQNVASDVVNIEAFASATGKTDFRGGTILIQPSRDVQTLTPAQYIGDIREAGLASSQYFEKAETENVVDSDRIVMSITDDAKIKAEAGQDLIAGEVANFVQTIRVKDMTKLFADAITASETVALYSTLSKNNANDQYATVPAGTQPTQGSQDVAGAISAISGGKRNIELTANLFADNGISIVRAMLDYGKTLGTEKNDTEKLYKFAIGGISLSRFNIFADYLVATQLQGDNVRQVVDTSKTVAGIAINGIVSFVDTVPVIMTNQTSKAVIVATDRVATRDLDSVNGMVAEVYKGGHAIKKLDGTLVQTSITDKILELKSGRHMAIVMPHEIWSLELV